MRLAAMLVMGAVALVISEEVGIPSAADQQLHHHRPAGATPKLVDDRSKGTIRKPATPLDAAAELDDDDLGEGFGRRASIMSSNGGFTLSGGSNRAGNAEEDEEELGEGLAKGGEAKASVNAAFSGIVALRAKINKAIKGKKCSKMRRLRDALNTQLRSQAARDSHDDEDHHGGKDDEGQEEEKGKKTSKLITAVKKSKLITAVKKSLSMGSKKSTPKRKIVKKKSVSHAGTWIGTKGTKLPVAQEDTRKQNKKKDLTCFAINPYRSHNGDPKFNACNTCIEKKLNNLHSVWGKIKKMGKDYNSGYWRNKKGEKIKFTFIDSAGSRKGRWWLTKKQLPTGKGFLCKGQLCWMPSNGIKYQLGHSYMGQSPQRPDKYGCVRCPRSRYPMHHFLGDMTVKNVKPGNDYNIWPQVFRYAPGLYDGTYGLVFCDRITFQSYIPKPFQSLCYPLHTSSQLKPRQPALPISCSSLGLTSVQLMAGSSANYKVWEIGCTFWKHITCTSIFHKKVLKRACSAVKRVTFAYADSCYKKVGSPTYTGRNSEFEVEACKNGGCVEKGTCRSYAVSSKQYQAKMFAEDKGKRGCPSTCNTGPHTGHYAYGLHRASDWSSTYGLKKSPLFKKALKKVGISNAAFNKFGAKLMQRRRGFHQSKYPQPVPEAFQTFFKQNFEGFPSKIQQPQKAWKQIKKLFQAPKTKTQKHLGAMRYGLSKDAYTGFSSPGHPLQVLTKKEDLFKASPELKQYDKKYGLCYQVIIQK